MIGLDTNILVRFFVKDDEAQSKKATVLLKSLTANHPGFVSQVALVEFVWVLSRTYKVERRIIAGIIQEILLAEELVVEDAKSVWNALHLFASAKTDFADCMIAQTGHIAGCEYTATFDATAAKLVNMQLLK